MVSGRTIKSKPHKLDGNLLYITMTLSTKLKLKSVYLFKMILEAT